jgi:hypothetical protein
MSRLASELHRLFVPQGPGPALEHVDAADLVGCDGRVRAMVLGLARPADWPALSKVWQGVQADLGLPAPAIAVAGREGYQLWFSLAEAVPPDQARVFLDAVRRRYLADIDTPRISLLPMDDSTSARGIRHAAPIPAPLAANGPWSAFVAPDLAPMFSEESWLDMPPNPEGQADLLSRLASIPHADFLRALEPFSTVGPAVAPSGANANETAPAPRGQTTDPRRFLLEVMNDERAPLALRIEAAKALLPYFRPDAGSDSGF